MRLAHSTLDGLSRSEFLAATYKALGQVEDGLGVMCTEHRRAYVKGLREARIAATASYDGAAEGGTEEAPAA